jgi:hypothetical protein
MSTATRTGNQTVYYHYRTALNAAEFNKRLNTTIPVGVYSGGELTRIDDTTVEVAAYEVEVSDGTYQVHIKATTPTDVTVAAATPYVVFRYTYSEAEEWYGAFHAVAYDDIQANDIVFGKCVYSGANMTGTEYSEKTIPNTEYNSSIIDMLKVTNNGDMTLHIEGGYVAFAGKIVEVSGGDMGASVAPVANPRIDLIYIDRDGNIGSYAGLESATPVCPDHDRVIPIAQIYLTVGMAEITGANITDVRPWFTVGSQWVRHDDDDLQAPGKIRLTADGGWLEDNETAPAGDRPLGYNGYFYATRVYNSVWNDIADFQELGAGVPLVYGACYYYSEDGALLCNKRCQKSVIGIASDTHGYGLGVREKCILPIAIGGWVLAHVDKEYEPGTPLTNDENGNLTKMRFLERLLHPERMVATYKCKEHSDFVNDSVRVNHRSWVKVR